MNNSRLVFKNTIYLTIAEVIMKITGFAWTVLLAHLFSVSEYGTYNLVNSFILIFSVLPDLGVGTIAIREIAKNKKNAPEYVGNVLITKITLSILTIPIIFATAILLGYDTSSLILIMIASATLILSSVRSAGIYFFEGAEKMSKTGQLNAINTVMSIGAGAIGAMLGYGLIGVFTGMLIGTAGSVVITWATLLTGYIKPQLNVNISQIKFFLKQGIPLAIAGASSIIYMRIDTVMLANMVNVESVGIYNAATPFVFALIQLLNVPFMASIFPALTRLKQESRQRLIKAVTKACIVIMLWSLPLAVAIHFFAPMLIPAVFGERYVESIPILRILIFFVPFASLSALMYKILIIANKQILYLVISVFAALTNVVLNLILIPNFDIFGAVYASLATQFGVFLVYVAVVVYTLKRLKK